MRDLFRRTPITAGLVVALGVAALLGAVAPGAVSPLALTDPALRPWSPLTYPFALDPLVSPMGLLSLVFLVLLLVQFGGQIEGETGGARYAAFLGAATLLPAAVACVFGAALAGPWLPSAAVVVAWGARNRTARVMLYGILPVSGLLLAGLVAAGVLVGYGLAKPGLGLAMMVPLGLAWLFASDRLPLPYSAARAAGRKLTTMRGGQKYDDAYFENVKQREMEREERERLRKLFEGD